MIRFSWYCPIVGFGSQVLELDAWILQADVLNSPLVLVARTDGEAATMIDSNIEPWKIQPLQRCLRERAMKDCRAKA
jgi:isocitrate lyase